MYSLVHGEVTLEEVKSVGKYPIKIALNNKLSTYYSKDGLFFLGAGDCILFPSKEQRDWNKFRLPVKRGDIMMTMDKRAFIANGKIDNDGRPCAHCGINLHHDFTIGTTMCGWTSSPYIPASEEAKKELFIKMGIAGYTWNAKTLKLEKIEPKYRPFRTKEECWNEMLKHQPFGWVKHTSPNEYFYSILEVIDGGCVFVYGPMVPFDEIYEFNTFADGTPFGIKE